MSFNSLKKLTFTQSKTLIDTDPDFIYSKKFDYSLSKLLDRYDGKEVPAKIVAQVLMLTEDEVADLTESVLTKLRTTMKVE
jgi:hypothetical protein